jgi:hypothetical protein
MAEECEDQGNGDVQLRVAAEIGNSARLCRDFQRLRRRAGALDDQHPVQCTQRVRIFRSLKAKQQSLLRHFPLLRRNAPHLALREREKPHRCDVSVRKLWRSENEIDGPIEPKSCLPG